MKCSHNLPLEVNCPHCFSEAMTRMRSLLDAPPLPTASKEERQVFWANAYRDVHPEASKPSVF